MKFKYAIFTLLGASLLAVIPVHAQDSKDCTLMFVEPASGENVVNIIQPSEGQLGITVVALDQNGMDVGESFHAKATCSGGLNAPATSASMNPLVLGATGQDTYPTGCVPKPPFPLPAGCPAANPHQGYCSPGPWSSMSNQPALYTNGNNNSFTILTNSQQVVSISTILDGVGYECESFQAQATTTCAPSACSLTSITVATSSGASSAIQVGETLQYTATGNYSDGSTLSLSPTNQTNTPTNWTSQDVNIATITSPAPMHGCCAGVATGTGAGETTVTAANGNISGSAGIAVTNPPSGGGGGGGEGCTGPGDPNQPQSKDGNCSPIILDIDGTGFALTTAQNGVVFNFSGHQPVQVGWTARGSTNAFLCLPDPNGRCDDGADLFGNFTPQPPSNHPNGFAALAVYERPENGGNGDGVIDSRDAIFASLRLWIDKNHDGISQPDELFTLSSLGVNSISLKYTEDRKVDQYGNVFRYRGTVNPGNPASQVDRKTYDVFFVIQK